MPVDTSSSVQPMRPSQAMASAKPGSAASLGSISISNGSGGIPAWMGAPSAPAPGVGSSSGPAYNQPGGNALSSSSMASAGMRFLIVLPSLPSQHFEGKELHHDLC